MDYAIEYLRSRSRRQSFFLCVAYIGPHHQNDHNHFEGPHGFKERFKNFRGPIDLPDSPWFGNRRCGQFRSWQLFDWRSCDITALPAPPAIGTDQEFAQWDFPILLKLGPNSTNGLVTDPGGKGN
jgi:hypothetical protein